MKKLSFIAIIAIAAIAMASCSKEEPGGGGGSLSKLQIFWGADEYTVNAGASQAMTFNVNGAQGYAIDITAKSSDESITLKVKQNSDNSGTVTATAPVVVPEKKKVTITLIAKDDANQRSAEQAVDLIVNPSEKLVVSLASDIRSMACIAGKPFTLPLKVTGLGDAKIVSDNIDLTTGWKGSCVWNGTDGTMTLTPPATVGNQLSIKYTIKDNNGREATLDTKLEIVEVKPTAGAANSYLVKPGSTLSIKAVEGNSSDKVDFNNASLVWQDCIGLVKSVAANKEEGVIVVTLNAGKSGNALVAAKNDETIKWSWHVWVSDYNPTDDPFVYVDSTSITHTFMDRNLGAMGAKKYSNECLGLFYQWGRKDPFIGASGTMSAAQSPIYDIDGKQVYMEVKERPTYSDHKTTNLQLAIQTPLTFYTAPSSAWPVCDWLTDDANLQNNDLWGGVSGTKTKYDPCPEGWTIPDINSFSFRKRYKKEGKLTDDRPYDPSYPWYIEYEDAYSIGFRYKENGQTKEYWFPFSGQLATQSGALERVGGGAGYYTRNVEGSVATSANIAWGNPASEFNLNRPYGYSVRCIKEK